MIKKAFYFIYALIAAMVLSGCNCSHISVQTNYMNREDLASYHVDTPDPRLSTPWMGQILIINWAFPKHYPHHCNYLELTMRYGNCTESVDTIPVDMRIGTYAYFLTDPEYTEREGILTYKVDLISDGEVLEQWRHQLWAERISVGESL